MVSWAINRVRLYFLSAEMEILIAGRVVWIPALVVFEVEHCFCIFGPVDAPFGMYLASLDWGRAAGKAQAACLAGYGPDSGA